MRTPEKVLRSAIGFIFLLVFLSGALYLFLGIDMVLWLSTESSICPLRFVTHHLCPGCGMTRAFFLIGQGRVFEAFAVNIFALPFMILMAGYFLYPKVCNRLNRPWIIYSALGMALIYWVLRW